MKPSSLLLIVLGCVILLTQSTVLGSSPRLPSPKPAPIVSPTPEPLSSSTEVKRPHPVRRLFSWMKQTVSRPFRRSEPFICRLPPPIYLQLSQTSVKLPCPPTTTASSAVSCSSDTEVILTASTITADGVEPKFTWSVTGGKLKSEGQKVSWDLSGVREGSYTVTVEMEYAQHVTVSVADTITVAMCAGCERPHLRCPIVSIACPADVEPNKPIQFEALVSGGDSDLKPTYTWSVNAGKIISGQGTSKITVSASEPERRGLTATVSVGDMHPACSNIPVSCTIGIDRH